MFALLLDGRPALSLSEDPPEQRPKRRRVAQALFEAGGGISIHIRNDRLGSLDWQAHGLA